MQARRRAGLRSFPEQMSLSSVRSETAFDRIMSRDRRSGVAKSTIVRAQTSDGSGSLPLQSSLMPKTYLKSDHFNGDGSRRVPCAP